MLVYPVTDATSTGLLPRSRQPADPGPRRDGVVLGPLRARRVGAHEPGRLAAARRQPRRPAARRGAHRRARRAARRGRGLRRAAGAGRRPRRAPALRRPDARLLHDGRPPAGQRRRASTSSARSDRPRAGAASSSTRSSSAPASPACTCCTACAASASACASSSRARRRRHVVLEPLPRRPLRHRVDGLLATRSPRSSSRSGSGASSYPAQPEILRYLNHVADRFDLRRDIQFEHARRRRAHYDEATSRWEVTTDQRRRGTRRRYCVMAIGCLSSRHRSRTIHGLDDFEGDWYHTGALAARGRRPRRQARRRHRHRLDRHPVDPADRQAGRAPLRLPADARTSACPRATGRSTRASSDAIKADYARAAAAVARVARAARRRRIPTCCRSARRSR